VVQWRNCGPDAVEDKWRGATRPGAHPECDGVLVKQKGNGDIVPSMMAIVTTRTRWRHVVSVETEHQTEIDKVYEHQEHKVIPEQRRDEPTAH
jgi:hypothetical protein